MISKKISSAVIESTLMKAELKNEISILGFICTSVIYGFHCRSRSAGQFPGGIHVALEVIEVVSPSPDEDPRVLLQKVVEK